MTRRITVWFYSMILHYLVKYLRGHQLLYVLFQIKWGIRRSIVWELGMGQRLEEAPSNWGHWEWTTKLMKHKNTLRGLTGVWATQKAETQDKRGQNWKMSVSRSVNNSASSLAKSLCDSSVLYTEFCWHFSTDGVICTLLFFLSFFFDSLWFCTMLEMRR